MRTSELKIVVSSLVTYILLCFVCLHHHLNRIPESLRLECVHAIQLSGGKHLEIITNGRNVQIHGTVPEDSLIVHVKRSLSAISGIRKLDMDLKVDPDSIQMKRLRFWAAQIVCFQKNSSTLPAASENTIDSLALCLNQHPGTRLVIRGWADRKGDSLYNQILSERRAEAVRNVLIFKQCDSSRLRTLGWGEQWPDSLVHRDSLARRVDFILKERIP